MDKIASPFHALKQFPSLKKYGLAVEHFPRYINQTCRLHTVNVVLLSVILKGRGRHLLGEEVYTENGGSVALTHYGQKHDIVTDAQGMEIYNVYLDLQNHPLPILPSELRPILSAILPIHPRLQHHLNRRIWIRIDDPAKLAASLLRIKEEMNSPDHGALAIVQHSFQVFLIDLCRAALRNGYTPAFAERSEFPTWLEKIRRRLDQDFAAPHTLEDLAGSAGVSIAYLCRLFKDYTRKPVFQYLGERRIHAAIWKLQESDEKIISIAMACGFNDLAYFNRVFKKIVGTTPSAYRSRFRHKTGIPRL